MDAFSFQIMHEKKIPILNVSLVSSMITSKTKINVLWKFFFPPEFPSGTLCLKIFQKTLILVFEEKSESSCQNGIFSTF